MIPGLPRRRAVLAALAAAVTLTATGCEVDVSASRAERTVLLAPDFVASTAAEATGDRQSKWLLNQPKPVRESYVNDVIDRRGDPALLATAWLLRQPDPVRDSYLREVVDPQLAP